MHAQAGTIGYTAILDEADRQAAKRASRTRTFGASTPSTAASPPAPHDAEASREAERLNAAAYLRFVKIVEGIGEKVDSPITRLLDTLEHELRHTEKSADWHAANGRGGEATFRDGQANALQDVIDRLKAL